MNTNSDTTYEYPMQEYIEQLLEERLSRTAPRRATSSAQILLSFDPFCSKSLTKKEVYERLWTMRLRDKAAFDAWYDDALDYFASVILVMFLNDDNAFDDELLSRVRDGLSKYKSVLDPLPECDALPEDVDVSSCAFEMLALRSILIDASNTLTLTVARDSRMSGQVRFDDDAFVTEYRLPVFDKAKQAIEYDEKFATIRQIKQDGILWVGFDAAVKCSEMIPIHFFPGDEEKCARVNSGSCVIVVCESHNTEETLNGLVQAIREYKMVPEWCKYIMLAIKNATPESDNVLNEFSGRYGIPILMSVSGVPEQNKTIREYDSMLPASFYLQVYNCVNGPVWRYAFDDGYEEKIFLKQMYSSTFSDLQSVLLVFLSKFVQGADFPDISDEDYAIIESSSPEIANAITFGYEDYSNDEYDLNWEFDYDGCVLSSLKNKFGVDGKLPHLNLHQTVLEVAHSHARTTTMNCQKNPDEYPELSEFDWAGATEEERVTWGITELARMMRHDGVDLKLAALEDGVTYEDVEA